MTNQNVVMLPQEKARLEALARYQIVGTERESEYEQIVRLAAYICQAPISMVNFIAEDIQWTKAAVGSGEAPQELPRDMTLCTHAIEADALMVVSDLSQDQRFLNNPFVTGDYHLRFYAGAPLVTPDHYKLGTLCVMDTRPRELTLEQQDALQILATQVASLLELRLQTQRLSELNQLKNKIFAIIAHDLRSPMTTLQSFLNFLDEHEMSAEKMRYILSGLQTSFSGTSELLNNLLKWATTQMDGFRLQPTRISLRAHCDEHLHTLQARATAKNIQFMLLIAPEQELVTDPDLLRAILHNLLTNCIKYTLNGQIIMNAQEDSEQTLISVRDTGVGIAPEQLATLFEWEHRQTHPGTAQEKGSGFGLLLAAEFTQLLGGSLRVESTLGVGTTFFLRLPKPERAPILA
jgi:signal transduction histidine kinase